MKLKFNTWPVFSWFLGLPLILALFMTAGLQAPSELQFVAPGSHSAKLTAASDLTYYAYGPLTSAIPSVGGTFSGGQYWRYIRNDAGHRVHVRFVNLATGNGPTYTLHRGSERWISVPADKSQLTHYAILLMGPELTLSGGVWTPRAGHFAYASASHPSVRFCSSNPLSKPAILNGLKASMSSAWRNAAHTYYVAPGAKACIKVHQAANRYMRLKVDWARGKLRKTLDYMVTPLYKN